MKKLECGTQGVQVCLEGCGGAWFERLDLQKFDELADAALFAFGAAKPRPPEGGAPKQRMCPHCRLIVMRRHFFSIRREAEVDHCGGCGGMWIDAAHLGVIRRQFKDGDERARETKKFYEKIFESYVKKKHF